MHRSETLSFMVRDFWPTRRWQPPGKDRVELLLRDWGVLMMPSAVFRGHSPGVSASPSANGFAQGIWLGQVPTASGQTARSGESANRGKRLGAAWCHSEHTWNSWPLSHNGGQWRGPGEAYSPGSCLFSGARGAGCGKTHGDRNAGSQSGWTGCCIVRCTIAVGAGYLAEVVASTRETAWSISTSSSVPL